jgi:hypothetical protein
MIDRVTLVGLLAAWSAAEGLNPLREHTHAGRGGSPALGHARAYARAAHPPSSTSNSLLRAGEPLGETNLRLLRAAHPPRRTLESCAGFSDSVFAAVRGVLLGRVNRLGERIEGCAEGVNRLEKSKNLSVGGLPPRVRTRCAVGRRSDPL